MTDTEQIFNKTKNLSVLFAEDYALLREETAAILKKYFAVVDVAEDGLIALEKYEKSREKNSPYDIVITDIEMPNKTGIELVQDIKSLNKTQAIVVLSAHQDSEYLVDLINLGIDKFIAKPLVYKEFIHTLYRVALESNPDDNVATRTKIYLQNGYVYDRLSNILLAPDGVVAVTKHEITILQLLSEYTDTVYSADKIVEYFAQNGVNLDAKNIRNMIAKLRKKFPTGTIESIYGVGYRLNTVMNPDEK